ncbi:hypothetical protein J6590_080627 [Homalodisca vitripennis]|nr:hypothetical protein J6590_080627 [Homalodisca vitripennis]
MNCSSSLWTFNKTYQPNKSLTAIIIHRIIFCVTPRPGLYETRATLCYLLGFLKKRVPPNNGGGATPITVQVDLAAEQLFPQG